MLIASLYLVTKILVYYEARNLIKLHTRVSYLIRYWASWIQCILSYPVSLSSCMILTSLVYLHLRSVHLLSGFLTKFLYPIIFQVHPLDVMTIAIVGKQLLKGGCPCQRAMVFLQVAVAANSLQAWKVLQICPVSNRRRSSEEEVHLQFLR